MRPLPAWRPLRELLFRLLDRLAGIRLYVGRLWPFLAGLHVVEHPLPFLELFHLAHGGRLVEENLLARAADDEAIALLGVCLLYTSDAADE